MSWGMADAWSCREEILVSEEILDSEYAVFSMGSVWRLQYPGWMVNVDGRHGHVETVCGCGRCFV